MTSLDGKTALITGGARRIGATIARALHAAGMNLTLHYRASVSDAVTLCDELNGHRPDSVTLVQADLLDTVRLPALVEATVGHWGQLDLLLNNASSFYPTPLADATPAQWEELLGSNLKAPFFLAQAAAPHLHAVQGNIVNLVDIYAQRPLDHHPIYSIAKAGLAMLTQALARELAPTVRVNGIAPGAILWPESNTGSSAYLLSRIPLQRLGDPSDIASTVLFLIRDGDYITGQVIPVDGGRSLFI